jgi:hypothetical protein
VNLKEICIVVCDQETSGNEEAIARAGLQSETKQILLLIIISKQYGVSVKWIQVAEDRLSVGV